MDDRSYGSLLTVNFFFHWRVISRVFFSEIMDKATPIKDSCTMLIFVVVSSKSEVARVNRWSFLTSSRRLLMVHCLIVKGNRVFARAYLRSRCQRGSNSYQSWTSDHRQNQKICLLCNLRGCCWKVTWDIGAELAQLGAEHLDFCGILKQCGLQLTQFSLNFPWINCHQNDAIVLQSQIYFRQISFQNSRKPSIKPLFKGWVMRSCLS